MATPDLLNETLISLAAAGRRLPGHRDNRSTNPSTIWRWVRTGALAADGRRVRLEAVRLGSRWLTSVEALARFAEALTAGTAPEALAGRSPTPAARRAASERAGRELERRGA